MAPPIISQLHRIFSKNEGVRTIHFLRLYILLLVHFISFLFLLSFPPSPVPRSRPRRAPPSFSITITTQELLLGAALQPSPDNQRVVGKAGSKADCQDTTRRLVTRPESLQKLILELAMGGPKSNTFLGRINDHEESCRHKRNFNSSLWVSMKGARAADWSPPLQQMASN